MTADATASNFNALKELNVADHVDIDKTEYIHSDGTNCAKAVLSSFLNIAFPYEQRIESFEVLTLPCWAVEPLVGNIVFLSVEPGSRELYHSIDVRSDLIDNENRPPHIASSSRRSIQDFLI